MFFQNPFSSEFRGNLVLGDRQLSLTFKCPAHTGRGMEVVRSVAGPFNLSGNDVDGNAKKNLVIHFSNNSSEFKRWHTLTTEISTSATTTTAAAVAALNANAAFADKFVAVDSGGSVMITQKQPAMQFRFYVNNTAAETAMQFNKNATVVEFPAYFARHSVTNSLAFDDAANALVLLNLTGSGTNVPAAVIDASGLDHTSPKTEAQMLGGRSGLFNHQEITLNGGSTTQIIEFPSGAPTGSLGRITDFIYTGGTNVVVDEKPYIVP